LSDTCSSTSSSTTVSSFSSINRQHTTDNNNITLPSRQRHRLLSPSSRTSSSNHSHRRQISLQTHRRQRNYNSRSQRQTSHQRRLSTDSQPTTEVGRTLSSLSYLMENYFSDHNRRLDGIARRLDNIVQRQVTQSNVNNYDSDGPKSPQLTNGRKRTRSPSQTNTPSVCSSNGDDIYFSTIHPGDNDNISVYGSFSPLAAKKFCRFEINGRDVLRRNN